MNLDQLSMNEMGNKNYFESMKAFTAGLSTRIGNFGKQLCDTSTDKSNKDKFDDTRTIIWSSSGINMKAQVTHINNSTEHR